jgi:hypothetical protein
MPCRYRGLTRGGGVRPLETHPREITYLTRGATADGNYCVTAPFSVPLCTAAIAPDEEESFRVGISDAMTRAVGRDASTRTIEMAEDGAPDIAAL